MRFAYHGTALSFCLNRALSFGQKLHLFGVENFRTGWVPAWLQQMDKLEFRICLVAGKANSKGKRKKHYRQLLKRGTKAAENSPERWIVA